MSFRLSSPSPLKLPPPLAPPPPRGESSDPLLNGGGARRFAPLLSALCSLFLALMPPPPCKASARASVLVDEFASDDEGIFIPGAGGAVMVGAPKAVREAVRVGEGRDPLQGASTTAEGSSLEDVLDQLNSEGQGHKRGGGPVKRVNKADLSLLRESLQYLDMHTSAVPDVPAVVAATRRENNAVLQVRKQLKSFVLVCSYSCYCCFCSAAFCNLRLHRHRRARLCSPHCVHALLRPYFHRHSQVFHQFRWVTRPRGRGATPLQRITALFCV
jgi:hypothetical protein